MGEVTQSKSRQTRVKAQKAGRAKDKPDLIVTRETFEVFDARLDVLERKQKLVTEGYEFVANETRNLFGFGAIAQIFDAIYEKLNK